MAGVLLRRRCREGPALGREEDRSTTLQPAPTVRRGAMAWGVALFGVDPAAVVGMIGPFGSADAARDYARAHCVGRWTAVPMQYVTDNEEASVR